MSKEAIDACLNCSLWVCLPDAPECYFVQIKRNPAASVKAAYEKDPADKIAQVRAWQKANPDKLAAAQSAYRKRNRAKINEQRRANRLQATAPANGSA